MEEKFLLKKDKLFCMLLIALLLLIIIPSSFAHENDTEVTIDDESQIAIESVDDGELLKATSKDYYFDASVENDGDGSIEYPYKYLTADRIKANANIYLANGEYKLDNSKTIEQVNFYGSDANETIIKYDGVAFKVWNSLTLTNLTISDATIMNFEKLNATNTIFAHGNGCDPDNYGNNYGGAIYCPYYTSEYTPDVHITNCTFTDNYAEYAGAIYMDRGNLDIVDTMFINNYAYNFGGAIGGEYGTSVSISRSKFYNSYSIADAGGAIYLRDSSLKMNNVEIVNSSATFGGAIASLNTDVSLNYLTVKDSSAKWDGGAIYHMYGEFSSAYGNFNNNSASNGGALFIDNSTSLFLRGNTFNNNNANYTAGAVYSLCNTLKGMATVKQFNRFSGNKAFFKNDEYELSTLNLTIGNGNYTLYMNNASEISSLPSYYSLRDHNLLTIPKDQQSSGNCWAFTAIAVLESAILKATGEYMDLSEENMKNVIAQFSDFGWTIETNEGGYGPMPIGYLASWLGPINETDDPFDDKGTLSPILNSLMHVQNVVYLNRENFLDNDEIKKAIMQYGAVGTSMYFDSNYLRWEGYYCWNLYPSNHAVTIVGWDDNYSRDHFYGLPSTCGDGAWIVRNSWGPNWNDDGYFYVSYYDEKFAQPGVSFLNYAIVLNDTIRYDKNYQYDIPGKSDFYYSDAENIWYKNIFVAESSELLSGVSTYFEKVTDWTLSVIVNGEVKLTKEGTSSSGYFTIDLGKFIHINAGDIFEVVFRVNNSDVTSFPISEKISFNKLLYKLGISYFSEDGENWTDLYNFTDSYGTHNYYSQVACIKAFTVTNPVNTIADLIIDYDGSNPVNITVSVVDQYGHILEDGNVTFDFDGTEYVVNISEGMAKITHNFKKGLTSISATFNGPVYNPSSVSGEINIETVKSILSADNLVMDYKDGSAWIVKLTDETDEVIADVNVGIGINGKVYYLKTDSEGIARLPINLAPGTYNLNATFSDDDYESSFVNATVTVNKVDVILSSEDFSMDYKDGSAYTVKLTDINGNAISNTPVAVSINTATYNIVTDAEGFAKLPINLRAGNYTISAAFKGNRYYNSADEISNTITVNKVVPVISAEDLVMTYKDGSSYEVKLVDNNGNAMVNAIVKITINTKTYNVKTDAKGIAKMPINLKAGQYTITARFDDPNYQSVSITNTVTVNLKSYISASDVNMSYKDGTTYDVQLVDGNGNPLAISGEIIKISIKGKTYDCKTNANGVASLPINLMQGNYTISAQYGDEIVNNNIVVNK